jgi:hypothetical protein
MIDQMRANALADRAGTGVCDQLEDALRTRLFSRDLIDQFSKWCNADRRVERIARRVARYLFSNNGQDNVPPRFVVGDRRWPDNGPLAQAIYEAWRDDVTTA